MKKKTLFGRDEKGKYPEAKEAKVKPQCSGACVGKLKDSGQTEGPEAANCPERGDFKL